MKDRDNKIRFVTAALLVWLVKAWHENCLDCFCEDSGSSEGRAMRRWCELTGQCVENEQTEGMPTVTLRRSFAITCCDGGTPETMPSISDSVMNFTFVPLTSLNPANDSCVRYHGNYSYISNATNDISLGTRFLHDRRRQGVRCLCPSDDLDRNCRHIRPCLNGGYRTSTSHRSHCVCIGGYFGEVCQFYCDHGQKVHESESDAERCVCHMHYAGVDCSEIVCLNGGTASSDGRGCYCRPPYLGKHCANRLTQAHSPDENLGTSLKKDFTGTVISLLLVVTLLCAMYCMLRRRLQHSTQRSNAFFQELLAARRDMIARELAIVAPPLHNSSSLRHSAVLGLPPSYSFVGGLTSSSSVSTSATPLADDSSTNTFALFPPLPSYEDAIKLPAPTGLPVTHLRMQGQTNGQTRREEGEGESRMPGDSDTTEESTMMNPGTITINVQQSSDERS